MPHFPKAEDAAFVGPSGRRLAVATPCRGGRQECDESHDHVQGRGKPLKETESYSYLFTDSVHKAFDRAAQSARTFACAVIALSDSFACPSAMAASFSLPPHVVEAQRGGV